MDLHISPRSTRKRRRGDSAQNAEEHKCVCCDVTFSKRSRLLRHERIHSGERPYACGVCHKSFARADHLHRHERTHTDERPVSCFVQGCSKAFRSSSHLRRHVEAVHDGGDGQKFGHKFSCDACGESFKKKSQLKKHSFIHTNVAPFACGVEGCERRYMTSKSLRRHEELHRGTVFLCGEEECPETFGTLRERREHIASAHPAICRVCGKQFKARHSLRLHAKVHEAPVTERRVFDCPEEGCPKSFTKRSNLRAHVNAVHRELRRFPCTEEGCLERFAHKHVMVRHRRKVHGWSVAPKKDEQRQGEGGVKTFVGVHASGGRASDEVQGMLRTVRSGSLSLNGASDMTVEHHMGSFWADKKCCVESEHEAGVDPRVSRSEEVCVG